MSKQKQTTRVFNNLDPSWAKGNIEAFMSKMETNSQRQSSMLIHHEQNGNKRPPECSFYVQPIMRKWKQLKNSSTLTHHEEQNERRTINSTNIYVTNALVICNCWINSIEDYQHYPISKVIRWLLNSTEVYQFITNLSNSWGNYGSILSLNSSYLGCDWIHIELNSSHPESPDTVNLAKETTQSWV